jgi:hypothetical protein
MATYDRKMRQSWACGFELPDPRIAVMPWSGGYGYTGDPPTVCAGYTTSLPETIEVARAWRWWKAGQLTVFVDGATVTPAMKHGIELFDGTVNMFERWKMTPRDKGGGAE